MSAPERDWIEEMDAPVAATFAPREHREYLVVGPPGCGKTEWVTRQVARAIVKYHASGVVVVSLTKAAAHEVAERNPTLPDGAVATLHSHAWRALDRPALAEVPEGIKEWNAATGRAGWQLIGKNVDDGLELLPGGDGDQLLQHVNRLRNRRIEPRLWPLQLQAFYQRWCEWKADAHRLDFTDVIERCLDDVEEMPGDPAVIMLDEAQDSSALEMALLRKWGQRAGELIVVGDPDQAIFGFRGGDSHAVFGTDLDRIIVRRQSYRVPQAVRDAALAMVARVPGRLAIEFDARKDDHGATVQGDVLRLPSVAFSDTWPVIQRIHSELDAGPDRQVMVMASCAYMLRPLVAEMKRIGLPFHNPYRPDQGEWNPLRGARRLLTFLRPDGQAWPGDSRLWTWDDLRVWADPLQANKTLTRGSKALIERKCQTDQFSESQAGDVVPIEVLGQLFLPDAFEHVLDLDVDWWERSLLHRHRQRQAFAVALLRRQGPAALHRTPRVIVGTIHSLKGSEADTVIVSPDLSTAGYYDGLKRTGDLHDAVIRLFYVAMTRARERLVLCGPSCPEHIDWPAEAADLQAAA